MKGVLWADWRAAEGTGSVSEEVPAPWTPALSQRRRVAPAKVQAPDFNPYLSDDDSEFDDFLVVCPAAPLARATFPALCVFGSNFGWKTTINSKSACIF